MQFDATISLETGRLGDVAQVARSAEATGFAGLWIPETQHNPLLALMLAAEHTQRLELGTAVAIAFPRSPMVTAQAAWDLQDFSQGRFILGLGTQVKAHIERRFGIDWESPVAKLREYIQALRTIWNAWQTGSKLDFRGKFYNHTLMSPFFNPGPITHPTIPIYIAGVNEGLSRLAGELCDGFHVHPFHSIAYLDRIVRPQIAAGAAQAGRSPNDITLVSSVFVVTGTNDEQMEQSRKAARDQIAFYASTPTYRVVLAVHGWEDVGEQLSRLAAMRRWNEMGALISDDMLDVFAVSAPFPQLGRALRARYAGVLDRISCYFPYVPGQMDEAWRMLAAELNRA